MSLNRDIAAVRSAVRPLLTGPVLVACSGGADSLALAAAVAFEAPVQSPVARYSTFFAIETAWSAKRSW